MSEAIHLSNVLAQQCRAISLDTPADPQLKQISHSVMNSNLPLFKQYRQLILELLENLETCGVMVPILFSIKTSIGRWTCERAIRTTQIVFCMTNGMAEDMTLLYPAVTVPDLATKLWQELNREGGFIEFEWEPFSGEPQEKVAPTES